MPPKVCVDDAAYGSADYDLPANGILTIRDTDKTRGGGRLRVKVTVASSTSVTT